VNSVTMKSSSQYFPSRQFRHTLMDRDARVRTSFKLKTELLHIIAYIYAINTANAYST